jgi:polyisoprenyl-phosphate glycosyltransferase
MLPSNLEQARPSAYAERLAIVVPIFNDWTAFRRLLTGIDDLARGWGVIVDVVAVDDASSEPAPLETLISGLTAIRDFRLVSLACNLGNQRAIAVGLAHLSQASVHDIYIVMDGDGQDSPEEIGYLLRIHREQPDAIITAQRAERSEGLTFRAHYAIYKFLFALLTGRKINFGNFCLIPQSQLMRLVYMSELWNHLASAIMRSGARVVRLQTRRGHRYAGLSKMNFVSLLLHGMSAMSVFGDVLFARLLVVSGAIAGTSIVMALIAVAIRSFTDIPIPGWATTVVGVAVTLLLQAVTLFTTAAFIVLMSRSSLSMIPALHAPSFIKYVKNASIQCPEATSAI